MIANEYAPLARRTLKELPFRQHMIHMGLGLVGEMGELVDAVKKSAIYGKPLDAVNLMEEVGDCLWYAANLLPELGVDSVVLQMALDDGYEQGRAKALTGAYAGGSGLFPLSEDVLQLSFGLGSLVSGGLLGEDVRPGSSKAVRIIEAVGGLIGSLAGILSVDVSQAMDRNIAKLAKRYGDKFSDVAALNRDTDAERTVLESGK